MSSDPYLIPGTDCLQNRYGITDPDVLAQVERAASLARSARLQTEVLPGEYDVAHLRAFHRYLFRDVYPWAGQIRTVNIGKDGAWFWHVPFHEDEIVAVLDQLAVERLLAGLDAETFLVRLAHYYGRINLTHPFREGNGRASRAFLRQMAAGAGWRLDWTELSEQGNVGACRHHLVTDEEGPLVEVLRPVVKPIADGPQP